MGVFDDRHQNELHAAGWHSRGYLLHFDGREIPQFITFHLADSIPKEVIEHLGGRAEVTDVRAGKNPDAATHRKVLGSRLRRGIS